MAGLSYINFVPSVVNALAGGLGFNEAEAGRVVALNGYGGIVGTTGAIFLVRRVEWRQALLLLFGVLTVVDLTTLWVHDYNALLGWRFLSGIIGGFCVGIAFSALARLDNPDRAFGLLLFVQFSVGSLVIYLLPSVEALLNAHAVFGVIASFSFVSWVFLLFLPALPNNHQTTSLTITWSRDTQLLMAAILAYQIAASGIWAYVGLIGFGADIPAEDITLYIATTGMLGLAGALLPVIIGNQYGRLKWVLSGVALSSLSAALLTFSHIAPLYILSMALLFFSWPAVQSFLLAMTAEMDASGQLSTIAGVVSYVGLATGPLLTSSLLDDGNFSVMLFACALIFLVSLMLLFKPLWSQEKERPSRAGNTFCNDQPKETNMIRYMLNKMLLSMQSRYDYDVTYMQDILKTSLAAFLKYMGFQIMASHAGNLPAASLFAARIRAIIWDDCGPCTQLIVDMALEAQVSPEVVRAIIDLDFDNLPEDVALVVQFTEYVLAHNPDADYQRERVVALWGNDGLVAIAFAISSSRVYPALKYTLGHGKACSRITVNETAVAPSRKPELTLGADHV